MKKPLFVGITGGIGSGKTLVAKVFETLGVPLYNADIATKVLMQTNHKIITAIKSNFGEAAYQNNALNRKYIAQIVFNDTQKLQLLNSIVHPYSIADANAWANKQTAPYVLKEAALLFETEAFHHVDYIIGVTAPKALRIQRVMQRDTISRDAVIARMQNQIDDNIKMKLCNTIVINDNLQPIIPQIFSLHNKLIAI